MTMSDVEILEQPKGEQQQQQEEVQEIEAPRQSQQQPAFRRQQQFQQNQNNKDRTLFCINIDPRCTEDILFELFLQAGPIENIVRKPDRNGNLICLVTYKHLESIDYSVKLFDKILLFGQKLSVKQSQTSIAPAQAAPLTPSTSAPQNANNSPSGYQKPYSRTPSYDHRQSSNQQQAPLPLHTPQQMIPPLLMAQMAQMGQMPFNLLEFMSQPILPFNNNNNNHQHHHPNSNRHVNQSPSPNNQPRHHQHHSRRDNPPRGHHYQQQQHDHDHGNYNRSRDNNRYSNEHDKRSRSPFDRNRRH